jgi:hypothetical protein
MVGLGVLKWEKEVYDENRSLQVGIWKNKTEVWWDSQLPSSNQERLPKWDLNAQRSAKSLRHN